MTKKQKISCCEVPIVEMLTHLMQAVTSTSARIQECEEKMTLFVEQEEQRYQRLKQTQADLEKVLNEICCNFNMQNSLIGKKLEKITQWVETVNFT